MNRRTYLSSIGTACTLGVAGCTGGTGEQENYPSQDIYVRVGGSEGGGTDAYARNLGAQQEEILDTTFRYEPGFAEFIIPLTEAYNEDNDGHLFLAANLPAAEIAYLVHEPEWDIRDFVPICSVGITPLVLFVDSRLEVSDLDDLFDRYRDGELSGVGVQSSQPEMMAHIMRNDDDWDWQWNELILYGGASPTIQAIAQGEVPVGFTADGAGAAIIEDEATNVEPLVVMSSDGSDLIDAPTTVDEGYPELDYVGEQTRAQFFPPETPTEIRDTMADSFRQAIESDEVQQWSEESGYPVEYITPEETEETMAEFLDTAPDLIDFDQI